MPIDSGSTAAHSRESSVSEEADDLLSATTLLDNIAFNGEPTCYQGSHGFQNTSSFSPGIAPAGVSTHQSPALLTEAEEYSTGLVFDDADVAFVSEGSDNEDEDGQDEYQLFDFVVPMPPRVQEDYDTRRPFPRLPRLRDITGLRRNVTYATPTSPGRRAEDQPDEDSYDSDRVERSRASSLERAGGSSSSAQPGSSFTAWMGTSPSPAQLGQRVASLAGQAGTFLRREAWRTGENIVAGIHEIWLDMSDQENPNWVRRAGNALAEGLEALPPLERLGQVAARRGRWR